MKIKMSITKTYINCKIQLTDISNFIENQFLGYFIVILSDFMYNESIEKRQVVWYERKYF